MKPELRKPRTVVAATSCAVLIGALAACDSREGEAPTRVPGAPDAPAQGSATAPQSSTGASTSDGSGAPAGKDASGAAAPAGSAGATPSAGGPSGSLGGRAISAADVEFVSSAASAGALEVEASRMALERSKTPAVRGFAQKLIDEHARTGAELRALNVAASVANVSAISPQDGEHVRKLRELEGREFDREFVAQIGIAEHQQAIGAFQKAADSAADTQVKTFAQAKLPVLREHLKMAQSLAQQVGPSPQKDRRAVAPSASERSTKK